MEKVNINGADLAYEVTGTGDPLLLIATGPIADSFFPFVGESALQSRYALIRYRQRRIAAGAGAAPVTFGQHAADAAALLVHLGIGRAHVAGHSTGAAIALELAAAHPERVQSLVLLEPPLLAVPAAGRFLEKLGPALAAYEAGDGEAAMARFLSVVCSLEWGTCRALLEERIPGAGTQAIEDAGNFFGSYLPALTAWEFGADRAAAITQPVLSVVGTDTEELFAESRDLLHAWFPDAENCTVEGAAHLLHIQRPEPVVSAIAAFCARHSIAASAAAPVRHRYASER
ncbi:MAG: alpha/beta fold hydrolase [Thermoanaerobaculia bacterium]